MFNIEGLCSRISSKVAEELDYDDEKRAVINYGIFAFIQTFISIMAVLIFGAIFKVLSESLIIAFSISILRKSSGGAHASSPGKCAALGALVSVSIALIIVHIDINFSLFIVFEVVMFLVSYYLVYKLAPVDSAAKPIKNPQRIKKLKKSSILILTVYLLITIINVVIYLRTVQIRFLIYSLCLMAGTICQVVSLTNSGHSILKKIDAVFK